MERWMGGCPLKRLDWQRDEGGGASDDSRPRLARPTLMQFRASLFIAHLVSAAMVFRMYYKQPSNCWKWVKQ